MLLYTDFWWYLIAIATVNVIKLALVIKTLQENIFSSLLVKRRLFKCNLKNKMAILDYGLTIALKIQVCWHQEFVHIIIKILKRTLPIVSIYIQSLNDSNILAIDMIAPPPRNDYIYEKKHVKLGVFRSHFRWPGFSWYFTEE